MSAPIQVTSTLESAAAEATRRSTRYLAGLQAPRGWGLYLIKNLVDEMHLSGDATQHTIELILYREGPGHGCETL